MGCYYSIYSIEDRKLIAILKHLNFAAKSYFLKTKEALRFKNKYILDSNGNRNLTIQSLVCLNDIINGGFYQRINKFSYFEPIWYVKKTEAFSEDQSLQNIIKLYNFYCITEQKFLEELSHIFLSGCNLTSKILFF